MSLGPNDLKGVILPIINLDEFDPKSGTTQEIIVIGLFATDQEPANDLNTFIQRGTFDIIDTEVSPSPDEDGNYVIFIEVERNEKFEATLFSLVKDIENLTGKMDWMVHPYLAEEPMSLEDPTLFNYIIIDPGLYKDKAEFSMETEIEEALKNSSLFNLKITEERVIMFMNATNIRVGAKIVGFGESQALNAKYALSESAINLSPVTEVNMLDSMLGDNWNVYDLGKYVVIESQLTDEILVVNDIQYIYGRDTV